MDGAAADNGAAGGLAARRAKCVRLAGWVVVYLVDDVHADYVSPTAVRGQR